MEFDAVVVGAGPAGASAALALARAGRSVVLVERGPFPGSKNVYGGVVYGRVLDDIVPRWWEEVPVERWVVRRSTVMMTGTQSLSVDFRTEAWGAAPFNGMTTLRCHFDAWLAGKATGAGARLVTSTVATGLVRDGSGRVVGVRTDRDGSELLAPVVIACDGVNSFLAKEAGLLPPRRGLPPHPRGQRGPRPAARGHQRAVRRPGPRGCRHGDPRVHQGHPWRWVPLHQRRVGQHRRRSLAPRAGRVRVRPEALVADLKAHPTIAPLLRGSTLREYAAHLIPEGGYDTMPALAADGLLIAGDAGAMTLAAGLWLEGVNFAIGSGFAAGRAADRALARHDCSAAGLASYRSDLEGQFVLADHKRLRKAPALVLSDRVQHRYPGLLCDLAEGMFTVTNPTPKSGGLRLTREAAARHGVTLRQLAGDTLRGLRIFG